MRNGRPDFDAQAFFASTKLSKKIVLYGSDEVIFSQGDRGDSVMYIQKGRVKLSVRSKTGREAVVARLGPGDFFGEGSLAGQPRRIGSATTVTASSVLVIKKNQMMKVLHEQRALSDRFISHMLSRNIRIEQELIDELFNPSEKRLARALLLLARYGREDEAQPVIPKVSHKTLAEITGTPSSRVSSFMKKFKTLGLIDHNGHLGDGIRINSALLSVVLYD